LTDLVAVMNNNQAMWLKHPLLICSVYWTVYYLRANTNMITTKGK